MNAACAVTGGDDEGRRLKNATKENHLELVGDNLAINFTNTRRMVEGQLTDTLQSDSDVKAWLKRLAVPVEKGTLPFSDGEPLLKKQESFGISPCRPFKIERPERGRAGRAQQVPGGCQESYGAYT